MIDAEHDLRCPITLDYFRDPVTTEDNQVYERDAIIRWITITGTDPITRKELRIDQLVPNELIKKLSDQRRKLSLLNSNKEDDQVELPPLKSVCINVPMMAISTNNNSCARNTRFNFSRCVRCSRICEWMRNIHCCCSLCECPCLCIITFFIIGIVGITSLLIISIVLSRSHGSS